MCGLGAARKQRQPTRRAGLAAGAVRSTRVDIYSARVHRDERGEDSRPAEASADAAPVRLVTAGSGAIYVLLGAVGDAPDGDVGTVDGADAGAPEAPGAPGVGADPAAVRARRLEALRRRLSATAPPAVRDVLAGDRSLLVEYRPGSDTSRVRRWLEREVGELPEPAEAREHSIPVAYGDGVSDDDRHALEQATGRSFDELAALHADATYTVAFLGFTAGFPYLRGVPAALQIPRRSHPSGRIAAGAVAVAGGYGGIYPAESPAGWWPLGRTPVALFDPSREPPNLMAPGDRVRFRSAPQAGSAPKERGDRGSRGELEVVAAWPRSASVQAAPRWGWGHVGLAQAGALDPEALHRANAAVGRPADAASIEALGNPLRLVAHAELRAAVAGGGFEARLAGEPIAPRTAFAWPAGAELELRPSADGYVSYLAIAGGLDVESWGGSASTDARAGVGGIGRFLEAGDRLPVGDDPTSPTAAPQGRIRFGDRITLPLWPGPQYEPTAFAALVSSRYRVDALDRTGARLAGPAIELRAHEVPSEGSPWGAVQVPPSGRPVVLLADRGRTGGYAKPAIVDPRSLWRLAQARPGTDVHFYDARDA